MKRFIAIIFLFLFFRIPAQVFAQTDNFDTRLEARYSFNEVGHATVLYQITSKNLSTEQYLQKFNLTLSSDNYTNINVTQNNIPINYELNKNNINTQMNINFPDQIVGKGEARRFAISFESDNFSSKTGKVWDIVLPKILNEDVFDQTDHEVSLPLGFGELASIVPEPTKVDSLGDKWLVSFDNKRSDIINITAGEYQVYSFNMLYHLENPLNKNSSAKVAIIPDTTYQKVFYKLIEPKPSSIIQDPDGNWLAEFELEPRQRLDISITGDVQLLSEPASSQAMAQDMEIYLKPTKYWQSDDKKIKQLAQVYDTPQKIYDYVVNTLSYDYERVTPTVHRLGALEALKNPQNAICMEFTDLFITIARAAGIPAREVNGYAYTDNSKLQPLSLVADVLHSWPQYWNSQTQAWVSVDPTWEKTTGGIDYFNKHDLRHIAFVIHGESDEKPYAPGSYKLGVNPQKDVFISFSQLPEKRKAVTTLSLKNKQVSLTGSSFEFILENHGPAAQYDREVEFYFDDQLQKTEKIDPFLPFTQKELKIELNSAFFSNDFPQTVKLVYADQEIIIDTDKDSAVLVKYFAVFLIILIAILFTLLKLKYRKSHEN